MPIKFEFELGDEDLEFFRRIMAQKSLDRPRAEIGDVEEATHRLLDGARARHTPPFLLRMLEQLLPMVEMLRDDEWRLPEEDAERVLQALSYFAAPEDLIPDDLPGLGYLDDAVMVELASRDLRPELEAYADFCRYRSEEAERRQATGDDDSPVSRRDWLDARRKQLQARMHRNRGRFFGLGGRKD